MSFVSPMPLHTILVLTSLDTQAHARLLELTVFWECLPDVILVDVASEPVREVEVLVVQGDENVGDQRWQVGESPAFHLHCILPDGYLCVPLARVILQKKN